MEWQAGAWPDAEGHVHRIKDISGFKAFLHRRPQPLPSGTGNKNPGRLQNSSRVKGPDPGAEPLYLGEISEDIRAMLLGCGVESDLKPLTQAGQE